jgi:predicted NBD/HSP70 family sugar kinase
MVQLTKATRRHTKDHNSRLVLQTIYEYAEVSRAELARLTQLTRTTVSDAVAELIGQGLVEEVGLGRAAIGRTPTLLRVAEDGRQMVVVNISSQELQGAVVNLRGALHGRATRPLTDRRGGAVLDELYPFVTELVERASGPLLGIGISAPGLIDMGRGIVQQTVSFHWQDLPLGNLLQSRFGLPVYLARDSHAIALANYLFGPHEPTTNLIAIKVGWGLGAGIVLNGQLFFGDDYGAGEIGHLVVDEGDLPCECGKRGCLETLASTRAIVGRARSLAATDPASLLNRYAATPEAIDLEAVLKAFLAGDAAVRQVVAEAGRYLGIAVAMLTGTFNIRRIVISGRIAPFGELIRERILSELQRRVLPNLADAIELYVEAQGPDTILLGGAALVLTSELGLVRMIRRSAGPTL